MPDKERHAEPSRCRPVPAVWHHEMHRRRWELLSTVVWLLVDIVCSPAYCEQENAGLQLRLGIRDDVVGCGLYQLSGYDDRLEALACPSLSGHKLMKKWARLEPQDGVYEWKVLDEPIRKIKAAGKRFMISPIIPDGGVPQWVYEAGATWIPKKGVDSPVDGTNFYADILVQGEVKTQFRRLHHELKWHPKCMDITALAGRTVIVRLSADCGKRAYYDMGLWARPRIVTAAEPPDPLADGDGVEVVCDLQKQCSDREVYIVVEGKRLPLGQRASFAACTDETCGGVVYPSIRMHPPWDDTDGGSAEPKRVVAEFTVNLPPSAPGRSLFFTFALGIRDVPPDVVYRHQTPVYWHPVLREKYKQFIAALGKRYDDEPGLELVYAGTGTYGETIISPDLWGGWDSEMGERWRRAGLTEEAWVGYVNEIVDAYVAAFPHTPVGLQISGSGLPDNQRVARRVAEHAVSKRVVVQYDGAMGQPFQWGGDFYVSLFKPLGRQTTWGLGDYGPSPGAGGKNWTGDLADYVRCVVEHRPGCTALVWYQDAIKATPGSKTYADSWARQLERCQAALAPGPSTHVSE